jgi:hypothetical protein
MKDVDRRLQNDMKTAFTEFPLLIILAKVISIPMEEAHNGWGTLVDHIDELLGTGKEIFDIEAHDNLIFDDDLYTRSRLYFWVINCTNNAENMIQGIVQTWKKFRVDVLGRFENELAQGGKHELGRELSDAIETCEEWSTKLKETQDKLREQQAKAVALRDGVCCYS